MNTFTETYPKLTLTLKKDGLKNLATVGQLDSKYIVAKLNNNKQNTTTLILIDQHAAHERIKFEYFQNNKQTLTKQKFSLELPININKFELNDIERRQNIIDVCTRFGFDIECTFI